MPGEVRLAPRRYHNHLDATIVTSPWTDPEELALLRLHEELGNKWSAIAQRLPGRQISPHIGLTTASRTISTLGCGGQCGS